MPGIVAKLSPRTSSAKKPRFLALLSNRLLTVRLIGAPQIGSASRRFAQPSRPRGIQPHRLRRYMASTDPQFEEKAADIIGLYLKPPLTRRFSASTLKSASQQQSVHIICDNLSAHKTKIVWLVTPTCVFSSVKDLDRKVMRYIRS
jgi:hypothetical protein